ncbi:MAG: hypothetical protein JWM99_3498 [Verrucomicrobiales bacterium]|nr:hypothetical protein [Verrucomicrobiales bacterium]
MSARYFSAILLACALIPFHNAKAVAAKSSSPTEQAVISLSLVESDTNSSAILVLKGADARKQLLVTAKTDDDSLRDYTRIVSYEVKPGGIAKIDSNGFLIPLGDGTATIIAKSSNGVQGNRTVKVENYKAVTAVNFANQIVPIFTKAGCNGGGCHGKSSGQNGFRLSLLGFEPTEDFEHLVREARGRRLFPAAPDRSLLLLKAIAAVPHGGGKRLDAESEDYRLLVRWISQGMPYGSTNDPVIEKIEVFPKERTMAFGGEQQLAVMARFNDGSTEDVTRSALYEPNDKEMAKTEENGLVKLYRQPGDVAVMIRYQAKVAVFRATIPLGASVTNLPVAKNFIDEAVFKKLQTIGMPPSELADDATFIRRVTIDITGTLPTPEQTAQFLTDTRPGKRERLIDHLIEMPAYGDYFAAKWAGLLRNKRADKKFTRMTYAFHDWLRDSLLENKPYDQIVRELLTASGEYTENPAAAWYSQAREITMQLEDTAQVFLAQRLKCAECHHHPFERWSQQDYYSFSAFFSQIARKPGNGPNEEIVFAKRSVAGATNKKTKQSVKPAGLGAKPLDLSADDDARQALVDWMTSKDNRFFARALVNRYWKHFFNRGLVEPEDDMRDTNPPTNPELLEALAKSFIESHYDLKQLVRTICNSQTYQLSSIPNAWNKIDKQNFSRYYPRRLTAEVLLDSVDAVTKSESKFDGLPAGTHAVELPDNSYNSSSYFLTVFGRPDMATSCECERSQDASLAQSLHLLNAKEIQDKLSQNGGRANLLAEQNTRTDEEKLRDLYFIAYSRQPDQSELAAGKSHVEHCVKTAANAPAGKRQAYEDIIWAVVNTKEFLFNH